MQSADTPPAACADLQAKYPALKGKSLANAINPHTPGYETIDPNNPDTSIGFGVDLGDCPGLEADTQAGDLRRSLDDAAGRPS